MFYLKFTITVICVFVFIVILFFYGPIYHGESNGFYHGENKLWAHRVLSIDEANKFSKEFPGIEVDVFFDKSLGVFDVRHHGDFIGLTLNIFIKNIKYKKLFIWLDLKNLNSKNLTNVINRLNHINNENNNFKKNVIIESREIKLLSIIKKSGYSILYFLPRFSYKKSISNIFTIRRNIMAFKPDAISSHYASTEFYANKFPRYDLYCFTNGLISENDKLKIRNISNMATVKVILTDFKENFLFNK